MTDYEDRNNGGINLRQAMRIADKNRAELTQGNQIKASFPVEANVMREEKGEFLFGSVQLKCVHLSLSLHRSFLLCLLLRVCCALFITILSFQSDSYTYLIILAHKGNAIFSHFQLICSNKSEPLSYNLIYYLQAMYVQA